MNLGIQESRRLAVEIKNGVRQSGKADIVLCPSFCSLKDVSELLCGSPVDCGAQDLFWEEKGAYTGEVSAQTLVELGCKYVIIGHSERRQYLNETDEMVNKKIKAALAHKLRPIVCVGESLAQREKGEYKEWVEKQTRAALAGVELENRRELVIAYEPIWAIGTGRTVDTEQVKEIYGIIKNVLVEKFGERAGVKILYGGSVDDKNVQMFVGEGKTEGVLVGGASLMSGRFLGIIEAVNC